MILISKTGTCYRVICKIGDCYHTICKVSVRYRDFLIVQFARLELPIGNTIFCVLLNDGGVQVSIFLFLMLIKGMRRMGEFKISLHDHRDGEIFLRSSASC